MSEIAGKEEQTGRRNREGGTAVEDSSGLGEEQSLWLEEGKLLGSRRNIPGPSSATSPGMDAQWRSEGRSEEEDSRKLVESR